MAARGKGLDLKAIFGENPSARILAEYRGSTKGENVGVTGVILRFSERFVFFSPSKQITFVGFPMNMEGFEKEQMIIEKPINSLKKIGKISENLAYSFIEYNKRIPFDIPQSKSWNIFIKHLHYFTFEDEDLIFSIPEGNKALFPFNS
ncbi:hypothetical protein [Spirochaeta cellobiosiphila]|uniref:hypothetical protein n=1 Tax=Spirochaeta cellobiosiphila TaxID=504483 RepID=UPI00040DC65E|nr:hypothetical protein [Spirochaeta cellobiosiphila]